MGGIPETPMAKITVPSVKTDHMKEAKRRQRRAKRKAGKDEPKEGQARQPKQHAVCIMTQNHSRANTSQLVLMVKAL